MEDMKFNLDQKSKKFYIHGTMQLPNEIRRKIIKQTADTI